MVSPVVERQRSAAHGRRSLHLAIMATALKGRISRGLCRV